MKFTGKVASGLKEGAYYVKIYKEKISKILHIIPFPGTLNLKCCEDCDNEIFHAFENLECKRIDGFDGLKSVKFIKCAIKKVNAGKNVEKKDVWIVIPDIRKHEFVEIISDACLRKELNLKDGDVVEICL